jgi:hypothetical protein
MGPILQLIVIVIVLAILSAIILRLLRPGREVVPEEHRLVIYRYKRFHRLAGPGWVSLLRDRDTVERTLTVGRHQAHDFFVDGLFIHGIPVSLGLNIWSWFDPIRAAAGSREKLWQLTSLTDQERHVQMGIVLCEVARDGIVALQQNTKLPAKPSMVDRILPVIPGTPPCKAFLRGLVEPLAHSWSILGVCVDTSHPITITRLQLPEDLIAGFGRDRVVSMLRQLFPDLSSETVMQMDAAIEGVPMPVDLQAIDLRNGGSPVKETRFVSKDGRNMIITGSDRTAEPVESDTAPRQTTEPGSAAPVAPKLSKHDLEVMKSVPPQRDGQKRRSA